MNNIPVNYDNYTLNMESEVGSDDMTMDFGVSVAFYSIQCILVLPMLYVNILVLRMIKREDLTISLELRIYAIVNIMMTLVELVHFGILKFAFPASQHFGIWYCYLHQVVGPLGMFRETIHTFTLSVYRYVFIIHRESIRTDKRRNEISWTISGMKWLVVASLPQSWPFLIKMTCLYIGPEFVWEILLYIGQ